MPLHAGWQLALGETGADDPEEEMAFVEVVAGLVCPFAAAAFVALVEGFDGDSVFGTVPFRSEGELHQGEGERPAGGDAGLGLQFGIGAVEDGVERMIVLDAFLAFLDPSVVDCAGKAEEVVWIESVHWEEEVTFVLTVLWKIEGGEYSGAHDRVESLA